MWVSSPQSHSSWSSFQDNFCKLFVNHYCVLGIGYKTPNSHRLTNPTHQSMLVEEEAVYVHVQNPIPPFTSENARNSEKMPENLENGKN